MNSPNPLGKSSVPPLIVPLKSQVEVKVKLCPRLSQAPVTLILLPGLSVTFPRSAVLKLPLRFRVEVASTVIVPELDQVPPKFALERPVILMLPVFDHVPSDFVPPKYATLPVRLMLPVLLKLPPRLAAAAFTFRLMLPAFDHVPLNPAEPPVT